MYKADSKRYSDMKYRKCGNSGLYLPAISLGLWQNFGSNKPYENSKEMLYTAFDLGITHFDLANNYGPVPGSAEENFGRAMKDSFAPYRDELIISTKAGYDMWEGPYGSKGSSRKYLLSSLDQSLKRMGLDYVDIFYSHCYNSTTPLEETIGALATAVTSGKALYVGISSYDAQTTQKASDILKSMGIPCLIHQPSYSMLNRWIETDLQDVLDKEGIGSIAFCPLAQGLLTPKYLMDIPEGSRATFANSSLGTNAINDELRAKLLALRDVADSRGQTLPQLALAWVLRSGKVTSALIGASSSKQITENVKTIEKLDFTNDELLLIEKILSK